MGLDYSIVLIFDKSKTWDVLEHLARRTEPDWDDQHDGGSPMPHIITAHRSKDAGTKPAVHGKLHRLDFVTVLYFEQLLQDEKMADYDCPRTESKPIKCQIGCIDLRIKFGTKYVMFDLRAVTTDMSSLFSQSISIRKWAVDILRRFDGLFGAVDKEDWRGLLFYKNGVEVNEETWPYSRLEDPDNIIEVSLNDPYSPQKDAIREEEFRNRPGQIRERLKYFWLRRSKLMNNYSFVLIFDASKVWDVLYSMNNILKIDDDKAVDMEVYGKERFEFEKLGFRLAIPFEMDPPTRKWWLKEKQRLLADVATPESRALVAGAEKMILSQNRCPIGPINLEIRSGNKAAVFDFKATEYAMNALFARSNSMRKPFVELLRKFNGAAGCLNRSLRGGVLFYLNGAETTKELEWVPDRNWPDKFMTRLPEYYK